MTNAEYKEFLHGLDCAPQSPVPLRDRKIIIFDSPDGTGKTNIAQALSLELKIPYFKMTTEHENWRKGKFKEALEFDQTYLVEFLKQTRCDVIIDRAYPAEWVYSKVYSRVTNEELLRKLDDEFARLGAYIIIPVRHSYAHNRKDEVVTAEMLPKLHEKYMEFRKWTNCSTVTIYVDDYENDLLKEVKAIRDELHFNQPLNLATNVTLSKDKEIRDIKDLFKGWSIM